MHMLEHISIFNHFKFTPSELKTRWTWNTHWDDLVSSSNSRLYSTVHRAVGSMCMHAIASTSSSRYVAASLAVLICGYQPAPAVERYRATCPHSPLSLICPISIQPPGPFIPNTHTCTWLLCSAAHKQSSKSDIIQEPASEKSCADAVKRRLLPVVTTEDRKWEWGGVGGKGMNSFTHIWVFLSLTRTSGVGKIGGKGHISSNHQGL